MEYLQYLDKDQITQMNDKIGFKPCYKWNTFNTTNEDDLILDCFSFKPCYKWNTFNTK